MEIVNKVEKSGIITLDLETYYTPGERASIDLKNQLFMGLILKEKDFREYIKNNDWSEYAGKLVNIYCSSDAIIPTWAYMLVANKLSGIAKNFVFGSSETLETLLLIQNIKENLNPEDYKDARIVIKGCGKIKITEAGYVFLTQILTPHVQSLMYGEPCSTVPVYKKTKV
jgi:hypothetical protein